MTSLLLDTHAFLWAFTDPQRLSARARGAIEDRERRIIVSSASVYELAFKHRLGKLHQANLLLDDLDGWLASKAFMRLDVTHAHALAAGRFDPRHRDPFDRLIMAQALIEDVELVSNEDLFDSFGVRRLW